VCRRLERLLELTFPDQTKQRRADTEREREGESGEGAARESSL
jgi:hypothetical protein